MMRRALAAAAGLAAALALAVLPAVAASAHDYLVSSDPAADATVTAPLSTVTLTFNDRVLDLAGDGSSTLLTVTGPDAATRHFETGCATVADRNVSAPVALGAAGSYTVTYQIVSADGHTVSNSYTFAYQPPAGTPEAAGSETTGCGAATAPATATPAASDPGSPEPTAGGSEPLVTASTPQPTQAANDSGLGLVIGIAIAIVVLAIAGVVIVVLTARRRPPAAAGTPSGPEQGDAPRKDDAGKDDAGKDDAAGS
ncbi:copper resistance protein CopC [Leifsonia sp. ZF2019]|uniref:copper resistance protein CopC n=1 Tax=Leifsonia sp. ZF2019 TaxID=2781978 RepID=UPI001CBAFD14|nr:copper resistance protein CopC [Leifsonia sp. ZF2019]UAJ79608.1 copper resistance protein CopC [Leifsonia sp. ZF2019]